MKTLALLLTLQLLRIGSFHGDEVPGDAAGRWAALVIEETGLRVEHVTVRVTRQWDPLVDNDATQKTGRLVEASNGETAVALLRGIELKEGPRPTFVTNRTMNAGESFDAGGSRVSLTCGDRFLVDGQQQTECALTLATGSKRRTLAKYRAYFHEGQMIWASESAPVVIWAGDLDGDGALDLLLDTTDHYNAKDTTIFLSSKGMASFKATGC